MGGFQLWANLPASQQDDGPALPRRRRRPTSPRSTAPAGSRSGSSAARSAESAGRCGTSSSTPSTSTSTMPPRAELRPPDPARPHGLRLRLRGRGRASADEASRLSLRRRAAQLFRPRARSPVRATDAVVLFGDGDAVAVDHRRTRRPLPARSRASRSASPSPGTAPSS
ncbi:MAG: hypothetical protein MZV64_33555 [Ignavibacteriales bacterium]|nr:hypothetical protein [Ignavibacteriales bacterium]